ncbi:MAG: hypothetical protein HYW63_01560 [Candidatus Levybacteria bacterium]|nr:hypothetical protein [Candidatus Levybacteria bacterium]
MAKKRTKKQKILADKRHVLYHLVTPSTQVGESVAAKSHSQESSSAEKREKLQLPTFELPQTKSYTLSSYAYVINDIRKTAIVTGAIIIAQVVLFLVLNRM